MRLKSRGTIDLCYGSSPLSGQAASLCGRDAASAQVWQGITVLQCSSGSVFSPPAFPEELGWRGKFDGSPGHRSGSYPSIKHAKHKKTVWGSVSRGKRFAVRKEEVLWPWIIGRRLNRCILLWWIMDLFSCSQTPESNFHFSPWCVAFQRSNKQCVITKKSRRKIKYLPKWKLCLNFPSSYSRLSIQFPACAVDVFAIWLYYPWSYKWVAVGLISQLGVREQQKW